MANANQDLRVRLPNRARLILDAALSIIGQRGYFGFSLQEVAKCCGLSTPGVLHHFPSKHKLLIALLADRDQKDAAALSAIVRENSTEETSRPLARVKRILSAVMHRNSQQEEIIRLYTVLRTEALYPDHPAYPFFERRDAWALTSLADLVTNHVDDPARVSKQLLALMGGLEYLWLRSPDSMCLVTEWNLAVDRLLIE